MAPEKRKRSANWMASEKNLLLDLVTEHFSVIENKKMDGVSMKQKLAEWVSISGEYNSQTMFTHRTTDNLKAQWEYMKKAAKKEASLNRMHLIQTRGGPSKPKTDDTLYDRIISLISTSAVGLHNPFDSDNMTIIEQCASQSSTDVARVYIIDTIPGSGLMQFANTGASTVSENKDCLSIEDDNMFTQVSTPAIIESLVATGNEGNSNEKIREDCLMDWGDYTPKLLQTSLFKSLRNHSQTKRRQSWTSKRPPQLSTSRKRRSPKHE